MKANMSLEPIVNSIHSQQTPQQDVDKCVDCPLCMEALDYDDLGFYPCGCGYQVCRFCWNRLKNDENGLCPACRQPYPDSPIQFSTISIEAVEELKKKKKKQKEKQKLKDAAKSQNLSSVRVVQKNLLFVIGLPQRLSQEDLRKEFIKYGKILKMVINQSSAYVTYSRPEDAVAAIKSLNETNNNTNKSNQRSGSNSATQQQLRASLGTTKYCTHWLRSQSCPKQPDCMYLHEMAEPEASFTKEEMSIGKHTEYEKRLIQHYWDLLVKERAEKSNRKNTQKDVELNGEHQHSHPKVESKHIVIKNPKQTMANHKNHKNASNVFNGETNGFGDECSNDSVVNGESGDSAVQSASPVIQCRWGTPTTRISSNCSSNSESNSLSNSLSSTPNQTSGAAQPSQPQPQQQQPQHPSPQEALVHQLQHGVRLSPGITHRILGQTYVKSGDNLLNGIDSDNAVDAQLMKRNGLTNGMDGEGDSSGDDMTADDDDGLDFDPISISSRGLQDLLRDSSVMSTHSVVNTVFSNQTHDMYVNRLAKHHSYEIPTQMVTSNQKANEYQNGFVVNNRQQMMNAFNNQMSGPQQQHLLSQHQIHSQQHPQQQPSPQWQTQQQNSLRQLLPNVNIAFRHQNTGLDGTGGNGFLNGFTGNCNTNSQQMIPNIRQQGIGHQMGGPSLMSSHPVMATNNGGPTGATAGNGVNVLPHFWSQSQQQQQQREHMLRLQQQQQQHQIPVHRQHPFHHNQRLYMGPPVAQQMSAPVPTAAGGRLPPPGF